MKLLVDQNLPARLLPQLQAQFPGSVHVNEVGLGGARDSGPAPESGGALRRPLDPGRDPIIHHLRMDAWAHLRGAR